MYNISFYKEFKRGYILTNLIENIQNIEFSRSLPSTSHPSFIKTKKGKGSKVSPIFNRAVAVASEALPLVSMVSPQLAFAGNFAGLTVKTLISLKNNNKFDALVTTATAVGFYARPILTAQVLHGASGAINLGKAVQQLLTKQYTAAGKSLLSSGYNIVYVGVLTTANPQLIAISLVAQASFSFIRAYQLGRNSKCQAAISALIGGLNGFAAYQRRADLLVPSEKYQAAFIEFKAAIVDKANEVVATVSQMDITKQATNYKSKLQNIKFEEVTGWVQENVNLATEFVKTSFKNTFQAIDIYAELRKIDVSDEIISVFKKIVAKLEQIDDYYIAKEDFDNFAEDLADSVVVMKKMTTFEKYSIFEDCCKRISSLLEAHVDFDAPSSSSEFEAFDIE